MEAKFGGDVEPNIVGQFPWVLCVRNVGEILVDQLPVRIRDALLVLHCWFFSLAFLLLEKAVQKLVASFEGVVTENVDISPDGRYVAVNGRTGCQIAVAHVQTAILLPQVDVEGPNYS